MSVIRSIGVMVLCFIAVHVTRAAWSPYMTGGVRVALVLGLAAIVLLQYRRQRRRNAI